MTTINFYQLANRRVEAVLPQLVQKALAAGHKVLIRSGDPALLARLDTALWNFAADSFIPHAIDTEITPDRAASQPVLLSAVALPAANHADCLAQIEGDLPDDLTSMTRVLYLFGADSIELARARWRTLANADNVAPSYWREAEGGRFEKAR